MQGTVAPAVADSSKTAAAAKVELNGKTATETATVSQNGEGIASVSDITITKFEYKPETIDASGGTSTPTVEYSQTVIYESGETKTFTQKDVTAELNFTGEAEGFTVIPQTGVVIATKNTDIERSVDVIVTVALNGKIKTARATVKQGSKLIRIYGGQSGDHYNIFSSVEIPIGYSVDVEFEVAYPKFGGGNGTFPKTYTRKITGGSKSPSPQFATSNIETPYPSDMSSLSITGGRIVSVSPKTVGDYTITFQGDDFIKSYDNPVITLNSNKLIYVDKNGGKIFNLIKEFDISCSQTERWYSGKTTENPNVTMRFYGSNSDFIIDSNTGELTTHYNGTGEYRSIDITVVATANGKSSSKTFTVYQMK